MWAKQTVGGLWTPVELTKFLHIFEVLEVQIINITPMTLPTLAQLAVMPAGQLLCQVLDFSNGFV